VSTAILFQGDNRRRRLDRVGPIWIVLALVLVAATLLSDRFLSPDNIVNVLHQGAIVGIVALGMTVVLISGHFDLSTGAVVMMAAVMSIVIGPSTPGLTVVAIILPLLAGAAVGLVNGLVVAGLKANSIIATLGMQFLLFGGVLAAVGGAHVRTDGETEFFLALAGGSLFGLPMPVVVFLGLAVFAAVLMHLTVYGRHLYAIGGDVEAARRAGIRLVRDGTFAFVLSGTFAAISGILVASRVRHLDPTGVAGYEFPALTAAVLGGAALSGGIGRPLDTVAAILVITIVTNVMTLKGLPYSSQLFAQGLILAAAVAYHEYRRRES